MFRLHKEGYSILVAVGLFLLLLNVAVWVLDQLYFWPVLALALLLYGFIVQFFRNPPRQIPVLDNRLIYAPADGRVCVIEEVHEGEYFKEKRLQISIFMSPLNVHVNRNPVSGVVRYFRYHAGKYLVAWHPKSSTENERTTVVYDTGSAQILMRQIAGAVAKRIKWYLEEGDTVEQGEDMGFIKFGSRVDLFLPIHSKVEVRMNQRVRGNLTVLARLP
ncbi:MAG: phosphatidylserine decarboxylase family protein [Saprospirales bacterium]|nr:phosphatidylserine decarboxylase family protein [Saprospirales bacterium]MBK8923367.1 phosphatidylserine decarboxylase family protein [Saprospirales bacterium]